MGAEEAGVEEVQLLPVGPFDRGLAEELAARLSRRVSAPCRVVDGRMPEPERLAERDQVHADTLLAALEVLSAAGDVVVVGVTAYDIAVPIFTFVFGRARQGGRAALVSLARLDPGFYGLPADADLLARRATDEILHELGHTASLPHCADASCLMSFAGSVEAVDVRGSAFCDRCRESLPRWLRGR